MKTQWKSDEAKIVGLSVFILKFDYSTLVGHEPKEIAGIVATENGKLTITFEKEEI